MSWYPRPSSIPWLCIFSVFSSVSKLTCLYCDAEIVSSNHPVLMLNETMNHLNQQDLRSKLLIWMYHSSCTFILRGNTFSYCIQTHNLVYVWSEIKSRTKNLQLVCSSMIGKPRRNLVVVLSENFNSKMIPLNNCWMSPRRNTFNIHTWSTFLWHLRTGRGLWIKNNDIYKSNLQCFSSRSITEPL